ncbi:ABC transporter permease [Acidisoma cladoniae]|jgi:ribose/xylose/arabinose/galactoside ABC-type transport system permease subunit|uniref:ABC transporter permease n=1 Tax=Acidisoma cladoniae TaxID=3040935 RepID=UPI0025511969|nr:ABC transporter permease [Acidisoma sp. PAMC 29798]
MDQVLPTTTRNAVSKRNGGELRALAGRWGIYVFLVFFIILAGILAPSFLHPDNLSNLVIQLVPLALVAVGQSLVILVRGLDLSVSSVMATAAVVGTSFAGTAHPELPTIVVAIIIGGLTGVVNGLLVTKRQVSPFLATLASMIVLQGLRFAWTHGAPTGAMPPFFRVIGTGRWHELPVNLLVLIPIVVIVGIVVHRTVLGRKLYITGGNPVTARLLGYRVTSITIGAYVASGVLAAIAGLVLGGYSEIVDNSVGEGFELDSIVAAVIGGFALSGGRGTVPGALAGAAVLVLVSNIVLLVGLPIQFQIILKGLVIVLAAACYRTR